MARTRQNITRNSAYACGCWYLLQSKQTCLPQVQLNSHTRILVTTSRTTLKQTFINTARTRIEEAFYTFPLYDGVSIVAFKCIIGDRVVNGIVKERNKARSEYESAILKGHTATLLEQSCNAGDVFTTSLGNIPAYEAILVEITYIGELKNDSETDGIRFTIPQSIAPHYEHSASEASQSSLGASLGAQLSRIVVDVELEQHSPVKGIQCPNQSAIITLGRTSIFDGDEDLFMNNLASIQLEFGGSNLHQDFVMLIQANGQEIPRALLETHPTRPSQRALMLSLVPSFNIPSEYHEIVFIVDRSGSMAGKMHLVADALQVFLRSLPIGTKFNICSFGSHCTFLFDRSRVYNDSNLRLATSHVAMLDASYGGTEMYIPFEETLKIRYTDLPLGIMLLTDGEIWDQQRLFNLVDGATRSKVRVFTLGIGSQASSSLVEGVARAGRGFAQWVNDGERIDKRVVRMLKGALAPHVDYECLVKYKSAPGMPSEEDNDDFVLIESFKDSMKLITQTDEEIIDEPAPVPALRNNRVISLFSPSDKDDQASPPFSTYDHLPTVKVPHILQTPHILPELYPHSRYTVYLILSPEAHDLIPSSVILRGDSSHGKLELEVPVQDIGTGETFHQLAAKRAVQELEEGRGWLVEALTEDGSKLQAKHPGKWELIVEREAVRLGTTFQVVGRFCSFVAIDNKEPSKEWNTELTQPGVMVDKLTTGSSPSALKSTSKSRKRLASKSCRKQTPRSPPALRRNNYTASGPSSGPLSSSPSVQAAALMPPEVEVNDTVLEQYAREMQSVACMPLADEDDEDDMAVEPQRDRSHEVVGDRLHSMTDLQKMQYLISLQTFAGSWRPSQDLWTILELSSPSLQQDRKELKDLVESIISSPVKVSEEILVTIGTLAWLHHVVAGEEDVWNMVGEKGRAWVHDQIPTVDIEQMVKRCGVLWRK